MITTIKIQNGLDCNYICHKINQAIVSYQKYNNGLNDTMIVIDIKKISDEIVTQKFIEYKPNESTN